MAQSLGPEYTRLHIDTIHFHILLLDCTGKVDGRFCYLNDRMATGRCFDGSSAALSFVVGPVMSLGVHLYFQLILAKLAGERPVERGQG